MIRVVFPLLALLAGAAPLMAQTDPLLVRARALLARHPLVDGHNDLPWEIRTAKAAPMDVDAYDLRTRTPGHTDLARLAAGGVGVQFWSIYIPGEIRDSGFARVQLEQFDIARRLIAKYPDRLVFATTSADAERARRDGKIASFLGLEGGHAIENSLGALRIYHELGARYMTLTHNVTLDWADAALGVRKHGGLTPFGRDVVREMNRLGMLVDLSHVSPEVMRDALDVTTAPVIFSHSSARALVDHPRNVPDDILRRLPKNGGVVMVTFVPSFVNAAVYAWEQARDAEERRVAGLEPAARTAALDAWKTAHPAPVATIKDVADHIEHVRRVAGIDHVGIGGDFDGIPFGPQGLADVGDYPNLVAELLRRGWSEADLAKLVRENSLRALAGAEAAAATLRGMPPGRTTVRAGAGPGTR